MMNVLTQSLWITLLSMGLVFACLLLLAGLMSVMTRMFQEREIHTTTALTPAPSPQNGRREKERAAAIAVALALAEQSQSTARPIKPPQPTIIGAWQLGMRTRQMTQKGEPARKR